MTEQENRPLTDKPGRDQDVVELDQATLDEIAGGGDKGQGDGKPKPSTIPVYHPFDTSSPVIF